MRDVQERRPSHNFDEARAAFDELIEQLSSAKSDTSTESEIERRLAKDGTEVLRRLMQGWFDRRYERAISEAKATPRFDRRPQPCHLD